MPAAFALEFGQSLYKALACLDFTMWAASINVTGDLLGPSEDALQYPIYNSAEAWTRDVTCAGRDDELDDHDDVAAADVG